MDACIKDINIDCIPLTDIDTAAQAFDAELRKVLDKHGPLKEMRVTDRKREMWFDEHIKTQKKLVRNREAIWNKYDGQYQHHWTAFTMELT